ncbi:hypothetical protein BVC80_8861g21 [Macleaya cordata]|uniref:Late embryogenesis abundant protein n=1 Tax=Macleaya cordata TaxID=56857 RepID=A0A200Q5W4_MACCD|nr:hypothetical protein BVC80_8861g21 [Macleaya cordata]
MFHRFLRLSFIEDTLKCTWHIHLTRVISSAIYQLHGPAAGFFSPPPADQKKNSRGEDLIVKEAHRVIVVEYQREGATGFRNPKILSYENDHEKFREASSTHHHKPHHEELEEHGISSGSSTSGMIGRANEKLREASSVLPNLGQGISSESIGEAYDKSKEMVNEAYCKAKECEKYKAHLIDVAAKGVKHTAESILGTLSHAKEVVSDKAHSVKKGIEDAKESANESLSHAKQKVLDRTHDFKEAVKDSAAAEALNRAKEKVSDKAHTVKEAFEHARDTAAEKTKRIPETLNQAREKVSDKAHYVKEAFEDAKDTATEKSKRILETLGQAKEKVLNRTHSVKDTAVDSGILKSLT